MSPMKFEPGRRVAGHGRSGEFLEGVITHVTDDRWGQAVTFVNERPGVLHGSLVELRGVDAHYVNEGDES